MTLERKARELLDDAGVSNAHSMLLSELKGVMEVLAEIDRLRIELEQAEARAAYFRKDAERFVYLQNCPLVEAQSFFWNWTSRKQRAKAIDAAIKESK